MSINFSYVILARVGIHERKTVKFKMDSHLLGNDETGKEFSKV